MDEKIDQHDVAKYLGISTKTVRTLIQLGELPRPIRIGRKQFWLKDKFTRWLHDGGGKHPCIPVLAVKCLMGYGLRGAVLPRRQATGQTTGCCEGSSAARAFQGSSASSASTVSAAGRFSKM